MERGSVEEVDVCVCVCVCVCRGVERKRICWNFVGTNVTHEGTGNARNVRTRLVMIRCSPRLFDKRFPGFSRGSLDREQLPEKLRLPSMELLFEREDIYMGFDGLTSRLHRFPFERVGWTMGSGG